MNKASATPAPRKNISTQILPESPIMALQHLIKLSRYLIEIADKECQALLIQDMMAFAVIQYEKERASEQYKQASEAFRRRVDEFRILDKAHLKQLEDLQTQLAQKMASNNVMVDNMRSKSRQTTQSTLFTVQQIAQQRPVFIETRSDVQGSF